MCSRWNGPRHHHRAGFVGLEEQPDQVKSDKQWFLDRSFRVEVARTSLLRYWVTLVHKDNPSGRVERYACGMTSWGAVRSAKRRFEVEQVG